MEKELQKEGAWAPLTPAKKFPARPGLDSTNGEWKNHLGGSFQYGNSQECLDSGNLVSLGLNIGLYNWDAELASYRKDTGNGPGLDFSKSIRSFEGEGSRRMFAEDVTAGKFSEENLNGAYACSNTSSSNSEELAGAKSSVADCTYQKTTSMSGLGLRPPLKAQSMKNQSILGNCIKYPAIPTPENSQAADQAVPRHSVEIPSTPPPTQATCQAVPRSRYRIPPAPSPMSTQTPAAHQASPRNIFQTPESHHHESLNKKLRQQRTRMKKHRPKVLFEGKSKKAPKVPKTPKNLTPKHAGSVKNVAKKFTKRVLSFKEEDLQAKDIGKDGINKDSGHAFQAKDIGNDGINKDSGHAAEVGVVFPLVDLSDLKEIAEEGAPLVDLSDQEDFAVDGVPLVELPDPNFNLSDPREFNLDDLFRKIVTSKRSRSRRVRKKYLNNFASENLHKPPNDFMETVEKDVTKIVHQYQRRKKGTFKSKLGFQDSGVSTGVSTAITFLESIPESKEKMVGSMNSVRVYKRRFLVGQCQKNSRKVGPNFPSIYKKSRSRRQKATTVGTQLSIRVAETGEKILRKEQDSHEQAATGRQLARKSNRKRMQKGVQKTKAIHKAGTIGCNHQTNRRFLDMISPTKEQTRAAINDQESFKCVLYLRPLAISRKKRSKVRRKILPFPTAVNQNIDQYPSAVVNPDHDQFSLADLGFVISPSPTAVNQNIDQYPSAVVNPGHVQFSSADLGIVISPSPTVSPSCPQSSSPYVQDLGIHSMDNAVMNSGRKRPKVFSHTPKVRIEKCTSNQADLVADIEDFIPNHQHVLRTDESASVSFVRELTDHIIQRLEALHISDECMQLLARDQSVHGSLVKFDPPKKRKITAEVDLDDETLRVWKLLMENEGSEPFEGMDKDKKEWWEKQREIFRGRIDSFVARMHDIQGDRRFSPWKGSVVDSIVGVYLTQNVSDHLSSNAFMSLAAKFPFNFTSNGRETGEVEVNICSQESVGSNVQEDGQEYGKSVSELEMGNQSADIIRDETPATESDGQDIIGDETGEVEVNIRSQESVGSNVQADGQEYGKSVSEQEMGIQSAVIIGDETPATESDGQDIIGDETGEVEVNICSQESVGSNVQADGQEYGKSVSEQEMGNQSADIIGDETPSTESGRTISDAIPDQTLEDSFHDGNPTTNAKPSIEELRHLDDDLQKLNSVDLFDLNMSLWDPLGILGSDNRAYGKRLPKYEHSNVSLDKRQEKVTTVENLHNHRSRNGEVRGKKTETTPRKKKSNAEEKPKIKIDWDELRKTHGRCREGESGRNDNNRDSVDWEAVRCSTVDMIAKTIKDRGMNNVLAKRIKDFLDRIYKDHGSLDLEWLRDVPPDKAKEYLLSITGIGLKSVECVRLLTLHHLAFPVDTNVARVAVRLGWVPLQPLAEEVQLHLLNAYPMMDTIQKYLWPRLCTLSQLELYELHYQMITFGKVFCTMRKPNCKACPMRDECRHYASAFASDRLYLNGPEEKNMKTSNVLVTADQHPSVVATPATTLPLLEINILDPSGFSREDQSCEPIIECPPSPGPVQTETLLASETEDLFIESNDEGIPTIKLNTDEFRQNLQNVIDNNNLSIQVDMSRALCALNSEDASVRVPKLKHVRRLRTVHQVYELPDSHPLLDGFERREPNDPSPYLLAIWITETSETLKSERCKENSCSSSCTTIMELNSEESAWGTILIPTRTATRGRFPLNGTYFQQFNEVFADDETSLNPIRVTKGLIWNLHKRTLHCGTSATSIFRGLSTWEIQHCFWKGYICVRGFNRTTKEPMPMCERFHLKTMAAISAKRKARDEK